MMVKQQLHCKQQQQQSRLSRLLSTLLAAAHG
jgi:hypothetical protein